MIVPQRNRITESPIPKIFITTGVSLLILSILVFSFQNCAKNPKYATDLASYLNANAAAACTNTGDPSDGPDGELKSSSDSSSTCTAETEGLSYPSAQPLILIPGQSTTLVVAKPSDMTNPTSWYWYATNAGGSLVSYFGKPYFDGTHFYISVHVVPDFNQARLFQLRFYDNSSARFFDQTGITVTIQPGGTTNYSADGRAQLCASAIQSSSPGFSLTRTNTTNALYIYDSGAGIEQAFCKSGSLSVNCFKQATWPANWNSQTFTIQAVNRCGTTITRSL